METKTFISFHSIICIFSFVFLCLCFAPKAHAAQFYNSNPNDGTVLSSYATTDNAYLERMQPLINPSFTPSYTIPAGWSSGTEYPDVAGAKITVPAATNANLNASFRATKILKLKDEYYDILFTFHQYSAAGTTQISFWWYNGGPHIEFSGGKFSKEVKYTVQILKTGTSTPASIPGLRMEIIDVDGTWTNSWGRRNVEAYTFDSATFTPNAGNIWTSNAPITAKLSGLDGATSISTTIGNTASIRYDSSTARTTIYGNYNVSNPRQALLKINNLEQTGSLTGWFGWYMVNDASTGGGAAIALYAPKYNVYYTSDNLGQITGKTSESLFETEVTTGSTQVPNLHCAFSNWTCNKDVTLTNGTTIAAGEPLTDEQIKSIVVNNDITLTAHHYPMPHITYKSDSMGQITGITEEWVLMDAQPAGSTQEPNENHIFLHWVADKDIYNKAGKFIPAGTELSYMEMLYLVVTEDIEFTAIHEPKVHVIYNTDGHGVITGAEEEWLLKNCPPQGSSSSANEGYIFKHWTSDQDVGITRDGRHTIVPAGDPLTMEEIKQCLISEDTVFTAHHRLIPNISVEKTSDKDHYNVDDIVHFTIKATQTVENTWATNVVISDNEMTAGLDIIYDSIKTNKGEIGVSEEGFSVSIDKVNYNEEIRITFDAKVTKENFSSEKIKNTATATIEEYPDKPFATTDEKPVFYSVETEVVNGTITPSSNDIINGSDFNVTYQPDTDFYLISVTVDGEEVDLKEFESSYDFLNIKDNHKIKVIYSKTPDFEIEKQSSKDWVDEENDVITYTATFTNTIKDSFAVNTTVKDSGIPGFKIDMESINIKNKDYTVEEDGDGFIIHFKELLNYNEKITLTYNASPVDKTKFKETYLVDNLLYTKNEEGAYIAKTLVPNEEGETVEETSEISADDMKAFIEQNKAHRVFRNKIAVIADGMDNPREAYTDVFLNTPKLQIIKKANKKKVKVGDKVKYTITVSQIVPDMRATDVVIKDKLPKELALEADTIKISDKKAKIKKDAILVPEISNKPVTITYTATANKSSDAATNIATATSKQTPDKVEAKETIKIKEPRQGTHAATGDLKLFGIFLLITAFFFCLALKQDIPKNN